MKKLLFAIFMFVLLGNAFGTPDRDRKVIDYLMGMNGNKVVIYQTVVDNLSSHYEGISEKYIVIKEIIEGKLVMVSIEKIETDSALFNFLLENEVKILAVEPIDQKYIYYDLKKRVLNYIGTEYIERDLLRGEYKDFSIMAIEGVYYAGDNILIEICMKNEKYTEEMRKILLLK